MKLIRLIIYLAFWLQLFFSACTQNPQISPTPEISKNDTELKHEAVMPADPRSLRHFMDAQLHMNQGNYAMAIVELQEALLIDPNVSTIYIALSECYWYLEKPNRALSYISKALEINPDDVDAREMLANQLTLRQMYSQAEEQYSILIDQYEAKTEYYYALGDLAKIQKQYDNALDYYQRAYDLNNQAYNILEYAADIATQVQNYSKAMDFYKQLADMEESDPHYLRKYIDASIRNGDYEAAIAAMHDIIKIDGNTPINLNQLATLLYETGEIDDAKKVFHQVLEQDSENLMSLHLLATLFRESGNFQKANEYSELLINAHPDDSRGYVNKALSALANNEPKLALSILKPVTDKFINNYTVQYLLGTSYNMLGIDDSTKVYIERALSIFPESVGALHILAIIYSNEMEWEKADNIYSKLITDNEKDAQALNNFAYGLAERDIEFEKAAELSKKSLIIEPNNPAYLDTYGWILYKLQKYEDAIIYIKKSLEIDGKNAEVLEHAVEILKKLDRKDEAQYYYHKAANLGNEEKK
ncbi:tetratricopeptide repeat protein [Candidatus Neomarinimicrobiota bacterium]